MAKSIKSDIWVAACPACKIKHALPSVAKEKETVFICEGCNNEIYVKGDILDVIGIAKAPQDSGLDTNDAGAAVQSQNENPGNEQAEKKTDKKTETEPAENKLWFED